MLKRAWAHRWGIVITAQMAVAAAAGYLTGPLSGAQVWLFRAVLGEAAAGTVAFIAYYARLGGWRSHIGQTILLKDLLLLAALVPASLSLYFRVTAANSHVTAAIDAAALASIGLTMAWRIAVWQREATLPDDMAARLDALSAENEQLRTENEQLRADLGRA